MSVQVVGLAVARMEVSCLVRLSEECLAPNCSGIPGSSRWQVWGGRVDILLAKIREITIIEQSGGVKNAQARRRCIDTETLRNSAKRVLSSQSAFGTVKIADYKAILRSMGCHVVCIAH